MNPNDMPINSVREEPEIEEPEIERHQVKPAPVVRKHYPPIKTGKGKFKKYGKV